WFYNLRTINGKDLRSRKMLVDCFVNSVILHDDRIDFYFNYKEGAKTLSLKKLKKSSDMLTDFPPNKTDTLLSVCFIFFAKRGGFESPLRKQSGGLFLGRGIQLK
ncbi:MAG: hypothetical protein IKK37_06520, partial [Clostridia bacterium]|nr:hypothetical protein [Clostridia bacterium]